MNASKPRFPWLYLALAYGLAWLFWIPVALTGQDYQGSPLLVAAVLVGVFGPGAAGIILTYAQEGKAGRKDLWRRVVDVRRIRLLWYVIPILLWPLLHLIAIGLNQLMGGDAPGFEFIRELSAQPMGMLVVVILYFVQAGLEELGWRGYMLDRMQVMLKPLAASLVVGISHALWHLPLFWVAGTNQIKWGFGPDFWLFIAVVVASSIYSTWCYNSNRRSTLAVIVLHFTHNLSLDIFTVPGTQQRIFNLLLVVGAFVIAMVWVVRMRRQSSAIAWA